MSITIFPASGAAGRLPTARNGTAAITRSLSDAACAAVTAVTAGPILDVTVRRVSGLRLLAIRTWWPAEARRSARDAPIMPAPMMPIRILVTFPR